MKTDPPKIQQPTAPRNRADLIADISTFTSGLRQISKCACDSIRNHDLVSTVDCIHKFYAGYGSVSASILSYGSILTPEEILKYLSTMIEIEKEFKQETMKLAKEYT
jgi:hypothetical protein